MVNKLVFLVRYFIEFSRTIMKFNKSLINFFTCLSINGTLINFIKIC